MTSSTSATIPSRVNTGRSPPYQCPLTVVGVYDAGHLSVMKNSYRKCISRGQACAELTELRIGCPQKGSQLQLLWHAGPGWWMSCERATLEINRKLTRKLFACVVGAGITTGS